MKSFYVLLLFCLFMSLRSNAQSQVYSIPVKVENIYLEDSIHIVGQLDLDFPVDGNVFIQFDGDGYGSQYDRIVLAANNAPYFESNDGNVSINSNVPGERNCFSHTRTYPVTAGHHSFYAVARNFVDTEGDGYGTVYGTFSVEFVPVNSGLRIASSIKVNSYDASTPIAFDSVTVEATGAGKIEVRFNGAMNFDVGDVVVVAVTDSKNWNYSNAGGIALEKNVPWYTYLSFSDTQVFDVPGPGTYRYYAMAHRGYEVEGDGHIYNYGHLHARYYPNTAANILESKTVRHDNLNLTPELRILDSIQLDITNPGKVEIRFDGALKSPLGNNILIAASNHRGYELENGSVFVQTFDEDVDRHTVMHTRVYDVTPGSHTFYIMAENYLGAGTATIDLDGNFLVKYYPESIVSANDDHFADLPFEVWPNPVSDQVTIQYENADESMIVSILNLQGHIVQQERNIFSGDELEISTLPAGMYIVQINNGRETGYKKLVKE